MVFNAILIYFVYLCISYHSNPYLIHVSKASYKIIDKRTHETGDHDYFSRNNKYSICVQCLFIFFSLAEHHQKQANKKILHTIEFSIKSLNLFMKIYMK